MLKELKIPELGENIESAILVTILVKPGDEVKADQAVAELETDKATAELPCPSDGVIKEVLVKVGMDVKIGQTVMTMEVGANETAAAQVTAPIEEPVSPVPAASLSSVPTMPAAAPAPAPAPAMPAPSTPVPVKPVATPQVQDSAIPAAPAVRRLARELGVNLSTVPGSGPQGRISIEDVKSYTRNIIASTNSVPDTAPLVTGGTEIKVPPLPDFSTWGDTEREPMSGVRRKTAESMTLSWTTIPHVTQNDRADITNIDQFRKSWGNKGTESGAKLTITAVIIKAVASALKRFPKFNASLDLQNQEIVYKSYVNIGIAVDAGHGLLVPVLRDVNNKNIIQIVDELSDISTRARAKKVTLDEMKGANFTISNLGGLGTTTFTPIINWPESAILGVGRANWEAVLKDGEFVPGYILPLSISYDHRLNDGADAARFVRWIAEALEEPLRLSLEG